MSRRNCKRSASRTQTNQRRNIHRSTIGRKIRVEQLQDRQLMAADFTGFGGTFGPQLPSAEPVPAIVSTAAVASTQSNAVSTDGYYHVSVELKPNGLIILNGTVFNDTVSVSQEGNQIKIVTETTYQGDYVGSSEATFDKNGLTAIQFFGQHGDDNFVNLTDLTTYAFGGEGNDTLQSGWGAENYLWGDQGDDVLKGNFKIDHINGGDGDDEIRGFGGNDYLYGEDGDDSLYGGNGDDNIYGGDDRDRIYGNDGDDYLRGGDDKDRIFGHDGDDTMFGDGGDDFMMGSTGDDVMLGGAGSDSMYGGADNDRMDGGSNDDLLYGGTGHDELFGRGGMDWLFGGAERDLLDGGDDGINDQLYGGSGDDIFIRHKHFGDDDPDEFRDFSDAENDEVFNDWFWSNYGTDFPT